MEVDKRKVLFWMIILGGVVAVLAWNPVQQAQPEDSGLTWQSKGATDDRCALAPDPGPCESELERYYFDQETLVCKSFTYGGCQGTVPFTSMEECLQECEGIVVGGR